MKQTKSKRKLDNWQRIRQLDLAAKAIAEREGIPITAAYSLAIKEAQPHD